MNRCIPNGTYSGVRVAPWKLKGHMPPEMAARVKPSQRPGTESCVVSGNRHGEA